MIPEEIQHSLTSWFWENQRYNFQILSLKSLGGGSINNVLLLDTSMGKLCLKYNFSNAFPKMFENESDGLQLLQSTGEIRVPRVIAVQVLSKYAYLLLEYIVPGRPVNDFMAEFGRSMARLHRHTEQHFGLSHDNYMGSLRQFNTIHSDWTSFFIQERLQRQVRMAIQAESLPSIAIRQFEKLYKLLENLLPKEKPSLLHGDLWSGNYLTTENGKACLIDPAVYYGHREIDIAMTTLFGGFDPCFYSGYQEIFALEPGWKERIDLYNLYPLLIHLNLFGSGYLDSILGILRKF